MYVTLHFKIDLKQVQKSYLFVKTNWKDLVTSTLSYKLIILITVWISQQTGNSHGKELDAGKDEKGKRQFLQRVRGSDAAIDQWR